MKTDCPAFSLPPSMSARQAVTPTVGKAAAGKDSEAGLLITKFEVVIAVSANAPGAIIGTWPSTSSPTEVDTVVGAGAAGHPVFLPREICMGPRCGRPEGGSDDWTIPMQKSDFSIRIRAMKPVKVSRAKGEMD
jgi:hypothetical protein